MRWFNWLSKNWAVGVTGGLTSAFMTTPFFSMMMWLFLPTGSTLESLGGVIKFAGITVGLGIAVITFAIKVLDWLLKWREFKMKMKQ
jgi:hypothetical protein